MPDVRLGERACLYAALHESMTSTLGEIATYLLGRASGVAQLQKRGSRMSPVSALRYQR